MSWNPETPYNDLPIPPPDLERVETCNVLNACISARAAIAKLKTVSELIPYQRVLINILPMLETKDSSRIENIITTSDQLFQYADCSGQLKLATVLEFFQYRFSDSFGGNPPLYSCGLSEL